MEKSDFQYEFEGDIIDFLFNFEYQNMNEDEYADALREGVDIYVSKNDDMHKDLVDEFGVFEAIELYNQTYGNYIVADKVSDNYKTLAFIIIHEMMKEKYSYERIKEIENLFYWTSLIS